MSKDWPFRYSLPEEPPPDGIPVTAEQLEQLWLQQLATHQRPDDEVLWDLAWLYSQTGRLSEALARVKQLAASTPSAEKKAACYLGMGQLMEQRRNYQAAITCYSEALALEPVDSRTWYFIHNNLGYCLNHFGRHAEAEPYCRRAIVIDPARYNAYKNLGIALAGQGDYAGAARCYIHAVQRDAADARALKHLEALAKAQPTVTVDVPDFEAQLRACRRAVQTAAQVWHRAAAAAELETRDEQPPAG